MNPSWWLLAALRESRGARGRTFFVVACISIGVAAVVGVASMTSVFDQNLRSSAREMLGADLRVASFRELPEELDGVLKEFGAERQTAMEFATMAAAPGGASRLIRLKAVESGYPFYGEVETDPPAGLANLLDAASVIAGPDLLRDLGLKEGDSVHIGGARYAIRGTVLYEPGFTGASMVMGPRVYMSMEGVERARLLRFGSRVRHLALYRIPGDVRDAEAAKDAVEKRVPGAVYLDVDTSAEGQRQTQRGLRQVSRYLGLVALVSLLLGGVGVSQIVRTWLATRMQTTAVMRCLGYRPREVVLIYAGNVLLLALAGSLAGCLAGIFAPRLLPLLAPGLLRIEDPGAFVPGAAFRGLALGTGIALLFSLPVLIAGGRVSPLRVLRADAEPLAAPLWMKLLVPAVLGGGLFGAAWVQAPDLRIAGGFTAGIAIASAALYLCARSLSWLAGRIPRTRLNPYVRNGVAALARPGAGTLGALVALGLGILVVMTVFLVERGLSGALREALPGDTPSAFLIDVQPPQWESVCGILESHGAVNVRNLPLITARLATVDGRPVEDLLDDGGGRRRRRWVLTREQRITVAETLPPDNRIVEGSLWNLPGEPEVSVERSFARDMGCEIGSRVAFDIQGVLFEFVVTSIRTVQWESFNINFFLIAEPGVLDEAPQLRIATASLGPQDEPAARDAIAAAHPNVTMILIREAIERVSRLLERLAAGVRILGAFAVATGLVILGGAVASTGDRRLREIALLKTLGVTRSGVILLLAIEYAIVGLVAGLIGGAGAVAASNLFLDRILEVEAAASLPWVLPCAGISIALTVASGLAASVRALRARPVDTLRA